MSKLNVTKNIIHLLGMAKMGNTKYMTTNWS